MTTWHHWWSTLLSHDLGVITSSYPTLCSSHAFSGHLFAQYYPSFPPVLFPTWCGHIFRCRFSLQLVQLLRQRLSYLCNACAILKARWWACTCAHKVGRHEQSRCYIIVRTGRDVCHCECFPTGFDTGAVTEHSFGGLPDADVDRYLLPFLPETSVRVMELLVCMYVCMFVYLSGRVTRKRLLQLKLTFYTRSLRPMFLLRYPSGSGSGPRILHHCKIGQAFKIKVCHDHSHDVKMLVIMKTCVMTSHVRINERGSVISDYFIKTCFCVSTDSSN